MTRKRGARRKSLRRTLPLSFGFTNEVLRDSSLQARSALAGVLSGSGVVHDIVIMIRMAGYCTGVCDQLAAGGSVEADGMADAIEAVNAGAAAVIAVQERLTRDRKISILDEERGPLTALVDAYEALLTTATRRESVAAMARIESYTKDL